MSRRIAVIGSWRSSGMSGSTGRGQRAKVEDLRSLGIYGAGPPGHRHGLAKAGWTSEVA